MSNTDAKKQREGYDKNKELIKDAQNRQKLCYGKINRE